jgi:hypothetical protein
VGQQQLLLIVLSAIIVGIAVYGGVRLMGAYQQSNERDALINQMNAVVFDARKYAAKTRSLGGGGGVFTGYQPPESIALTDRFRIYVGAMDSAVTLTGFGTINGEDGQSPVQVFLQYTLGNNRSQVEVIN